VIIEFMRGLHLMYDPFFNFDAKIFFTELGFFAALLFPVAVAVVFFMFVGLRWHPTERKGQ
jgi:hypothetical protein